MSQVVASSCLVIVNGCNIPTSFSSLADLMGIQDMDLVMNWMKMIELSTFVLVPLTLVGWKVWERIVTKRNDDATEVAENGDNKEDSKC